MKDSIKQWAKAAGVRALKSAAQGAVALVGTTAVTMGDVQWGAVASGALLLAVLSLLTSVAGVPEVEGGASVPKIAKGGE